MTAKQLYKELYRHNITEDKIYFKSIQNSDINAPSLLDLIYKYQELLKLDDFKKAFALSVIDCFPNIKFRIFKQTFEYYLQYKGYDLHVFEIDYIYEKLLIQNNLYYGQLSSLLNIYEERNI